LGLHCIGWRTQAGWGTHGLMFAAEPCGLLTAG
jgi:hypothetical protein